jgi:hypothetical protein
MMSRQRAPVLNLKRRENLTHNFGLQIHTSQHNRCLDFSLQIFARHCEIVSDSMLRCERDRRQSHRVVVHRLLSIVAPHRGGPCAAASALVQHASLMAEKLSDTQMHGQRWCTLHLANLSSLRSMVRQNARTRRYMGFHLIQSSRTARERNAQDRAEFRRCVSAQSSWS